MEVLNNEEFSRKNQQFINACVKIGLPASARQASKWRNGKGLAFQTKDCHEDSLMAIGLRKGDNVVFIMNQKLRP